MPANTFVVVDAHYETLAGEVQRAAGVRSALTSEVLSRFCGQAFLQKMYETAERARGWVGDAESSTNCSASPALRGGWRGLLLVTCSQAVVLIKHSFDDLVGLVRRWVVFFWASWQVSTHHR